ncbi:MULTISPECIES: metallophosphoesterase [unclassified Rhizobium]|uniref:metallophosphoesterase n=1 Tax=unclassified Rhizobium TaxID=2613769 RepID=UPI0007EAD068|nr:MULTISPECIES: metallophosphoesterase [unclassified Rhizobium]ANM09721.1 metallophosphoesterase domain-containing protein [Rhizobium sp. N324]ANM16191.1 metallophosphoesterase domain-containing protein [Rhizobium sp. N541]ANM22576.1 metallophosphoesterase domain-containing protein [Rhizobium sp. N941]OYD03290.1 metallophosphoesterase domain-containing protein [Rhizobium sp. N4311]
MSSPDSPLFRFGIIADPQYAAIPPHAAMDRYYANSLAKVAEAIEVFNSEELSFVMTLGDVIDRSFKSFDDILPIYETLRHEALFLLGNHDFSVSAGHLSEVAARLGTPSPYYSFSRHGWRFIVLDGNEVSTFAPPEGHPHRALAAKMLAELRARGERNAHPWNGALSYEQFAWLGDEIASAAAAGEKVIVMNHYPVYPAGEHDMWDCDHIVALLAAHDNVVAYLNGHNHAGNYGKVGACHFVNFKGVVDTESENAFAIVDVHPDRIEIRGFGREDSRTLVY